ncbi:MAG TPA: hypothetical protein VHS59_13730, partial [Bacillota bacterium]|nr:hypothetical protein [Bacillota bacterium]
MGTEPVSKQVEDSELALTYFRRSLEESLEILSRLSNVYYTLSMAAAQLNSKVFAHRREVDDAVDRTVDVGKLLDKVIPQVSIQLAEYQA